MNMQKYLPLLIAIGLFYSCNQKTTNDNTSYTDITIIDSALKPLVVDSTAADSTKKLIEALAADTIFAGKGIGQLLLGQNFDEALQIEGDPYLVDTTKKTLMLQWKVRSADSVQYYTIATFESTKSIKKIKQIATTSFNFKTQEQVGVGSTLAFIKVQYPTLKKAIQTVANKVHEQVTIYDDVKEGIAFEINGADKCTVVGIHTKGQKYIPSKF